MRTVLYPGSFDPVTTGHMDLIARAAARFEKVIVGVLHNPDKPSGVFLVERRLEFLEAAVALYPNVEVAAFAGLLVDAVAACCADGVLRGLRTPADAAAEIQMAQLNRQLGGVETVFMAASPGVTHVSSTMVRQIGRLGGWLDGLVPEAVLEEIADALLDADRKA